MMFNNKSGKHNQLPETGTEPGTSGGITPGTTPTEVIEAGQAAAPRTDSDTGGGNTPAMDSEWILIYVFKLDFNQVYPRHTSRRNFSFEIVAATLDEALRKLNEQFSGCPCDYVIHIDQIRRTWRKEYKSPNPELPVKIDDWHYWIGGGQWPRPRPEPARGRERYPKY